MASDGRRTGLGCAYQGSEAPISSAGDRSFESQQSQSVRPYGRQSQGYRNRGCLPGSPTADLPDPRFRAGTVRGARLTIGARHDHLNSVGILERFLGSPSQ